ncbi:TPA: hypothetical protein ACH3X2_010388 [Trebouxia sp. C0005]
MSRYEFSPELVARHQSSCSDDETAESELRANKQVIRDHQLAKYREALLPMAMLEPGLVLQSVPKGHSASAKEVECIRADYDNMKAEHEQRLKELSDRLKSQEATRRRAQKDLLKLREEVASSQSLSTSANQSAEMETASLIQELSDLYLRLNEAKKQIAGFQSDQAHCLAKSEAAAQSVTEATAEVVTLKQELAEVSAHARAMEADLASAQQAESELKANKGVIRDSQLAKYREALLSMSILEPGLVLQSVPKGHSASAKEVEYIKEDQNNIKAQYEQTIHDLTDRLKSQTTTRRRAQKDLLKLREDVASSNSSSAHRSTDLDTTSLVKEVSELTSQLAVLKIERDDARKQLEASVEIVQALDRPSCDQAHAVVTAQAHKATESLKVQLAAAQDAIGRLHSQLAEAQQLSQSQQQQLTASSEEHVSSKKQLAQLAQQVAQLEQVNESLSKQNLQFQDLGGPSATALQAQLEVSEARLATSRWQVTQLNQQVSQLQSQQHAAGARRVDGWGRDVEVKKLIEAAQNEAAATRALAASMPSLAQERSAALTKQLSQLQAQLDHTCNALEQQKQEAVSMKLALEEKVSAANDETAALRAQLEEMQAAIPLKRSPLKHLQADMLTPKLLYPVSQEKQQPRQEGKENGGSPDTPPAVLNPSPFLLRSALASSPCSSARSSSSNDRNANERFSASAVARAPPALQPAAELSFTSLVHAPVVTPFPAAGRLPLLLEASVPTPPPVKADEQAETADATASDPQQTSGSTVKSAGRHRSGLLAAVSNLSTTVKSKLTPGANSSGSGKQSSGSSTSSTTPQRFRAHTPEPATATPATARHGSMTSQSSAAQTTASECITSSDNSSDKAVLGAADSSAPQRSPAAKAITAVGRMLRRRPAADNSGGGRSSTVHSSSLSMPVQQKRIAASHGRVPPKAEANAVQIRANAASSAVIGSSTSSGPAAPIDAQGARAQEQHKVDTKRSAGNSANAEGQDEVGRKGMVGSRLFGLRPRVARHAEKAEAQKRADTTAGKAEQAASASQSKPRPKSQQSVSTRAAVAQTQSRSRQPRVTIKDKVSANGQMKAQVPRRFAF